MSKDKIIVLENEHLGKREFKLSHAKALIALEHQKKVQNWAPLTGSKYKIENGELITGGSDKPNQES